MKFLLKYRYIATFTDESMPQSDLLVAVVKVRGLWGLSPLLRFESPAIV